MKKAGYEPSSVRLARLIPEELRDLLASQAYFLWDVMMGNEVAERIQVEAAKALPTVIRALLDTDKHVGKVDVQALEKLAERLEASRSKHHGTRPARISLPPSDGTDSGVH